MRNFKPAPQNHRKETLHPTLRCKVKYENLTGVIEGYFHSDKKKELYAIIRLDNPITVIYPPMVIYSIVAYPPKLERIKNDNA